MGCGALFIVAAQLLTLPAESAPRHKDPPPAQALRSEVLAAHAAGDLPQAIAALDRLEHFHPDPYAAFGFDYLAGTLFIEAGNPAVAARRLRREVTRNGPLAGRAAYRLALLMEHDRPAAALPLVAGFARRHPRSGIEREARLLEVVLTWRIGRKAQADRLVASLPQASVREAKARLFVEARDAGRQREAFTRARELLLQRSSDDPATQAAEYVLAEGSAGLDPQTRFQYASALLGMRRFDPALAEFERVVATAATASLRQEALFQLGRGALKVGEDPRARAAFERLEGESGPFRDRATYHLGRIDLLCGEAAAAVDRFQATMERAGSNGPAGVDAAAKLARLAAARDDREELERLMAAVAQRFGASSTVMAGVAIAAAGQALRAGSAVSALAMLDAATTPDAEAARRVTYWRGVALLAAGREMESATTFLEVMRGDDLLAALARTRFATLPAAARPDAGALLAAARSALAANDPEAARKAADAALAQGALAADAVEARQLLLAAYLQIPAFAAAFELEMDPEPEFPVTLSGSARSRAHLPAAHCLRTLGLDAEAADALRSAGESGNGLAELFTIAELARRGGDTRTALRYGDLLSRRLPPSLRRELLPMALGRLLHPDAFPGLVEDSARTSGVDPALVRAIMREESRFDPNALSAAGARGLMQFIPETARHIGAELGLAPFDPRSLHDPALAIKLGAEYLARLVKLFDGREGPAVAAYNAGEDVVFLWLSRTGQGDLDEFFREIEFDETRAYVDRVLTSLAVYRERNQSESVN